MLVPLLAVLAYALSAGPVVRFSFFHQLANPRSSLFSAAYRFYGPLLALNQTKPLGKAFWAYMRLWGWYPGGAYSGYVAIS